MQIDWPSLRTYVSALDVYYPHSWLNRFLFSVVNMYEKVHSSWVRDYALELTIDHIRQEDSNTKHIDIGPVNKCINMLAIFHAEGPNSANFKVFGCCCCCCYVCCFTSCFEFIHHLSIIIHQSANQQCSISKQQAISTLQCPIFNLQSAICKSAFSIINHQLINNQQISNQQAWVANHKKPLGGFCESCKT
jgi:hypothetical protein